MKKQTKRKQPKPIKKKRTVKPRDVPSSQDALEEKYGTVASEFRHMMPQIRVRYRTR